MEQIEGSFDVSTSCGHIQFFSFDSITSNSCETQSKILPRLLVNIKAGLIRRHLTHKCGSFRGAGRKSAQSGIHISVAAIGGLNLVGGTSGCRNEAMQTKQNGS